MTRNAARAAREVSQLQGPRRPSMQHARVRYGLYITRHVIHTYYVTRYARRIS